MIFNKKILIILLLSFFSFANSNADESENKEKDIVEKAKEINQKVKLKQAGVIDDNASSEEPLPLNDPFVGDASLAGNSTSLSGQVSQEELKNELSLYNFKLVGIMTGEYEAYVSLINSSGEIMTLQLHEELDFSFDIDEVINQVTDNTKMIIINSPNNPCGSVIPNSALEALARVAIDKDLIILSDEIYSRYLYEGSHQSITKFPGLQERTVILDGFSKTYAMTGWRIGYGIMPIPLVEPISRLMTNSVSCTASFTQIAAIEALTGSQKELSMYSQT